MIHYNYSPEQLENKAEDLLRQFDESTNDKQYDNRKGFMERVKELFQ